MIDQFKIPKKTSKDLGLNDLPKENLVLKDDENRKISAFE